MKHLALILVLLSYAAVFWRSEDAVAPLALLIPYLLIGGVTFSIEAIAAVLGIAGTVIACGAFWKKERSWRVVASVLLISSVVMFVSVSSDRMFGFVTALPFAACTGFWLYRSCYANDQNA